MQGAVSRPTYYHTIAPHIYIPRHHVLPRAPDRLQRFFSHLVPGEKV
jgi:hypothetical protein